MRTIQFPTIIALTLALAGGCDSKDDAKKDGKDAKDAKDGKDAKDAKDAKKDGKEADPKAEAKADVKADPAGTKTADATGAKNVVETAVAAGNFTTLATALEKADLVTTLAGPGPFTVFAPTDEAFAKVPKEALDALLAKPEDLKKVLLQHVIKGKVSSADAAKLTEAETAEGTKLPIEATDGVKFGGAKVTKADIEASNGVIHVIDTVILPKA